MGQVGEFLGITESDPSIECGHTISWCVAPLMRASLTQAFLQPCELQLQPCRQVSQSQLHRCSRRFHAISHSSLSLPCSYKILSRRYPFQSPSLSSVCENPLHWTSVLIAVSPAYCCVATSGQNTLISNHVDLTCLRTTDLFHVECQTPKPSLRCRISPAHVPPIYIKPT